MSSFVLGLDAPDATLDRVGGKGANLADLTRAGFAVPPGFLVTTEAYRAFVDANRLGDRILELARAVPSEDPVALEHVAAQIHSLFDQGSMPDELGQAIASAYASLSAAASLPVAVRSSATAEDLPGMSFAGQQDTYLNIVGEQALLDAVRRCWASLWTARAIGYRARNGIAPDNVALAVVVQQLVMSDVSGVLFTANPLTGRRAEIVIDASFGLGEAIVSGQVEPDHYVVDPHSWTIISRKLGAKALAIVPRAGGGTDNIARGGEQQALSDAQILELARTAARVAEHFGTPQDIEWAFADGALYLLQSRPITSLYPLPPSDGSGETRAYWSFGSVQGVLDPFTPMGRDMVRKALARALFSFLEIESDPAALVAEAGDRLYIDITGATALWSLMFANIDPAALQTLQKLLAEGRLSMRRPFTRAQIIKLLPKILPAIGRAVATLHAPEYHKARANARAEAFLAEAHQHARQARDLGVLVDALQSEPKAFMQQVMPYLLPVVFPGVILMKLVDHWLIEWLGMQPGAVFQLLRGLPGNVTSEMDLRLWAEVQAIRADGPSREVMLNQPIEGLVEAYKRGELPAVAQGAIRRFMQQYGMRGVGEIDFGRRRWREDVTPIVQTMHNYLQQANPDQAPDVLFARGAAEAARLTGEWVAQARRGPYGRLRAALLAFGADRMRKLIGMRESPKFFIVRLFGIYRAALLEQAQRLAGQGVLAQAEDIFFLHFDDLRRYARGEPVDLRAIVSAERASYERERARRRMPRLILSTGEAFYEGLQTGGEGDLVGDPVSPGVVEGRAHVVLDPHGVRLQPGEILVCQATDPGWTPLFLTAGGLVMEIGGMVTHGSVVAREYGIPAVVGVHEATARIQSGQRIRVDGTQGRVTLLDDEQVIAEKQ
jgi:pyruvate,water dikinase